MPKQLTALSIDSIQFPNANNALDDPEGLLAIGGDLSPERLLNAYQHAIFPWFSDGEPILWWSPAERAVIQPQQVHISKSMEKFIRQTTLTVTINHVFKDVVKACAQPRKKQSETWISPAIQAAYYQLHLRGVAHSVEVWDQDELVGGLYGVNIGGIFCGESMFHQQTNASKLAFIAFSQHFSRFQGQLIDCQMMTAHLQSLGVTANTRVAFIKQLEQYKGTPINLTCWNKQVINPRVS
ncbi:leucyl/phenylalanyl-tRNA--protein transferase [Psychromonas arctica]|uniref:leucyl/phenylalanyl-tRNA--protein transferase n=1 Tax=Psychromonas arctica TaxID=168275 RepID=UPI000415CD36|nr:leucyl/phenylalanyl-tRNA--protein transferase [Psychromonas arctica]